MMDVSQRIIEDLETLSETIEYDLKGRARYGYQDAVGEVIRFIKHDVRDKVTNLDAPSIVISYVGNKMKSLQDGSESVVRAYQDIKVVTKHHKSIVERVFYV